MRSLLRFLRDQDGQDLIEYSLGVAFVALLSAAVFASAGSSTGNIWGQANNTLAGANTSLASPAGSVPPPDPGNGGDGNDGGGDGGGDGGNHHHDGDH